MTILNKAHEGTVCLCGLTIFLATLDRHDGDEPTEGHVVVHDDLRFVQQNALEGHQRHRASQVIETICVE